MVRAAEPLVSVSIITYQQGPYIRQCLDSVLMQKTDFPFEILLGEDGSTDGTREICCEYAEKHPDRIRLFLHDRRDNLVINGRATGRRNLVNNLKNARGEFLALLDGDDYWTDPRKLQLQVDALRGDPAACGVFHDFLVVNEITGTEQTRFARREVPEKLSLKDLILDDYVAMPSMFLRNRKDWDNLPPWFFTILQADIAIPILAALHGHWLYLDRVMSVYRIHSGGIWMGEGASQAANQREKERFFRGLAELPEMKGYRGTIRIRHRMELRRLAAAEARAGHFLNSFRQLLASVGRTEQSSSRYLRLSAYLRSLLLIFRRPR